MARKKRQRQPRRTRDALISTLTGDAPKKKPAGRRTELPISSHKSRAAWFNAREAWPWRESPVETLMNERARAAANIPVFSQNAVWQGAGPSNVGGRMTCVVVHPADSDRIWAGSAGGGVWSSADGGVTWNGLWHDEPTLNIGALAIDAANPDTLYCATGEANLSADSHAGVGVYRSLDSGVTWQMLASSQTQGVPRRIGRIAIDPFDSNHILIAGVGHRSEDARGLFSSSDGGVSWARISTIVPSPYHCHEALFHPTTQGTIYTAIDVLGSANGIWRSTDGGLIWTHLTSGLPAAPLIRRAALAIAPSQTTVIYAQLATRRGAVLGVFRSANGGNTWTNIGGNHFNQERQMNYNNTISVDPADSDTVICGGVDLHRTRNRGQTWTRVTRWDANRGAANYAHANHHALIQPPASPGLVHDLNDGGMDVSLNGGSSWQNRSNGLATNMFYDLSIAASNGDVYGGGMQDNGTWLTFDGTADTFFQTTGGDGGYCAIDPNNELHLFTSSQSMRINRFRTTDGWSFNIGPNEQGRRPWMAVIAMDPVRSQRVFVASTRVWRSLNDGAIWAPSNVLDGSFISCIEISRANTNVIYVGTEFGGIFKSSNGGATWTENIASSALPGRTVTRLRTPANDADIVYATIANFGNSHLFQSVDGGDNWQDVDDGTLPDVPHHGIVIPSTDANRIYVGGDAGVFVSDDGAATWHNLTSNLPTISVVDLVINEQIDTLFAATYGRSVWRLDLSVLP